MTNISFHEVGTRPYRGFSLFLKKGNPKLFLTSGFVLHAVFLGK
jgi:hypothetical protein